LVSNAAASASFLSSKGEHPFAPGIEQHPADGGVFHLEAALEFGAVVHGSTLE
jgi:hypothetical protein